MTMVSRSDDGEARLSLATDRPWPEIAPPADLPADACVELREHNSRVVWAEGNPNGSVMIVLDNPGARETKDGVPYVCPTRLTLRKALEEAGVDTDDVYVTYLLKRRPTRAYDRSKAWAAYMPFLEKQVRDAAPRALLLAGNVVVHALIDPDEDVKALRGRALQVFDRPAVVTYHPLAARRRPALFPKLVEDLRRLKGLS